METNFQYQVLSPKLDNNESLDLAYYFWKKEWTHCFEHLNTNLRPRAVDFFSRDLISFLYEKNNGSKPIGIMLHKFYSLEDYTIDSDPYFVKNYEPEFLKSLRKIGLKYLMTFEYLSIKSSHRKIEIQKSLVPIFAGLCYELFAELNYDAQIAPCRVDLKVHERALDFGAQTCFENRILHNVPVVSMFCLRENLKKHNDFKIKNQIDLLYSEKLMNPKILLNYKNVRPQAA